MAGKSADADIKCTDFGLSVYFKPGQKFKEVVGSGEGQRGQGGDEREGGCLEEAICWDMGEGCLMRHSHTHHTHTRPPPPPAAYFGSLLATLYVSLAMRSYLFSLVFCAAQLVTLLYYVASYFPGGASGAQASAALCSVCRPLPSPLPAACFFTRKIAFNRAACLLPLPPPTRWLCSRCSGLRGAARCRWAARRCGRPSAAMAPSSVASYFACALQYCF